MFCQKEVLRHSCLGSFEQYYSLTSDMANSRLLPAGSLVYYTSIYLCFLLKGYILITDYQFFVAVLSFQ